MREVVRKSRWKVVEVNRGRERKEDAKEVGGAVVEVVLKSTSRVASRVRRVSRYQGTSSRRQERTTGSPATNIEIGAVVGPGNIGRWILIGAGQSARANINEDKI